MVRACHPCYPVLLPSSLKKISHSFWPSVPQAHTYSSDAHPPSRPRDTSISPLSPSLTPAVLSRCCVGIFSVRDAFWRVVGEPLAMFLVCDPRTLADPLLGHTFTSKTVSHCEEGVRCEVDVERRKLRKEVGFFGGMRTSRCVRTTQVSLFIGFGRPNIFPPRCFCSVSGCRLSTPNLYLLVVYHSLSHARQHLSTRATLDSSKRSRKKTKTSARRITELSTSAQGVKPAGCNVKLKNHLVVDDHGRRRRQRRLSCCWQPGSHHPQLQPPLSATHPRAVDASSPEALLGCISIVYEIIDGR